MNSSKGYSTEIVLGQASVRSVWNQIATDHGLSEWLAPNVKIIGDKIQVDWDGDGNHRTGRILSRQEDMGIKWEWTDDPASYFSMTIVKTELSATTSLIVEDCDLSMEVELLEDIWNYHTIRLKRSLGVD